MAGKNGSTVMTPNSALLRTMAGILVSWLLVALLVFAGAGRLDWGFGSLFVALWGLLKLVFILLLHWHDPELMVERASRYKNTQQYERPIIPVYFMLSFGTLLVAGLDGGRFRWSGEMPAVLIVISYVVYLFGNGLASWAVSANPFFSSESRLQMDRE